jgi:FMNH2-dependent dimethyl sulfone monooxygenase
MPVFGGWLRNIPDEGMEASWDYVRRLTQRSEETGWDLTLIAELNLNDIKGVEEPALDAWSTAAALAAVTSSIELMVAVRPNFHHPALFAKAGGQYRQHLQRAARAQRRLLLVG